MAFDMLQTDRPGFNGPFWTSNQQDQQVVEKINRNKQNSTF